MVNCITTEENSSGSSQPIQVASVKKQFQKGILFSITAASIISFFSVEILFFYFRGGGISRYPENLAVSLLVLTICFCIQHKFVSAESAVLTLLTSTITLVFVIDWFLSDSAHPAVFGAFVLVGGQIPNLYNDLLLVGFMGGIGWFVLVAGVYALAERARKATLRQTFQPFRAKGSRVVGFFDKHPWAAAVLMSIFTLVVGIIIGTNR